VILTSNVGAEELSRLWLEIEHTPNRKAIIRKRLREEFRRHNFRVEFLNRVDELLLFRTLQLPDYVEITRRLLHAELDRLREGHGIEVVADESVCSLIGGYCAGVGEGARAAQRLVQSAVITPVIDHVVRTGCGRPARVRVRAVRGLEEADCEPEGRVESIGSA
jgi:ATP-dependent Clp protease ATP-binding subunit ClpA